MCEFRARQRARRSFASTAARRAANDALTRSAWAESEGRGALDEFPLYTMKRARNVNGSSRTSSGERALVIAALLSLYLVWGSTYYAMRIALVTLPPYLMAATRFSIAGFLLFAFLLLRGARLPSLREWLAAGAVGTLLLVMGNGFVLLAERSVDSGTAATVVATMPLWMAGLGWLLGERPRARELLGFSAYGYLLSKTRPLIATSYAYVNPVVALAIGALLGGERLSLRKLGACALTAVGVLIVTLSRRGVVFRPVEPARAR